MAGSLTIEQHQVFINFRGEELRYAFLSHLVTALENHNINVYIHEDRGESTEILLERIEESRIALVFVSGKYTESTWCLRELARIKDCVQKGKLVAIPIFYKLDPSTVRYLRGQFGDAFRDLVESDATKKKEWEKALNWIPSLMGIIVDKRSNESKKVDAIVVAVKRVLLDQEASVALSENIYTGIFRRIKQHLEKLRHKLDLNKIRSQLGMIIVCLLLLFSCLQQVAYMSTLLIGEGGAINRIVENVPKGLEYFPAERTVNANFLDRASTNSPMDGKVKPPNIQVFINFRGEQLRKNFVGYLVDALRRSEINVFIDNHEQRGEDLNTLFTRIEDSGIAIVVFSSRYTESKWCLEELVKIKERVHQGLLKVLPIYYKVTPTNVKRLKGEFGDHFRDKEYMYGSDEPKIK